MKKQPLTDFERLVELYYRPVFNLAVGLCGKLERALALTQHTFCLALERQNDLRQAAHAKSWLLTILFREFLKEKRREALRSAHSSSDKLGRSPRARRQHVEPATADRAPGALTQMREELRIPFILFYLKDFSCSQIAEYLGISMEAVLGRLSHARRHFRLARAGS